VCVQRSGPRLPSCTTGCRCARAVPFRLVVVVVVIVIVIVVVIIWWCCRGWWSWSWPWCWSAVAVVSRRSCSHAVIVRRVAVGRMLAVPSWVAATRSVSRGKVSLVSYGVWARWVCRVSKNSPASAVQWRSGTCGHQPHKPRHPGRLRPSNQPPAARRPCCCVRLARVGVSRQDVDRAAQGVSFDTRGCSAAAAPGLWVSAKRPTRGHVGRLLCAPAPCRAFCLPAGSVWFLGSRSAGGLALG